MPKSPPALNYAPSVTSGFLFFFHSSYFVSLSLADPSPRCLSFSPFLPGLSSSPGRALAPLPPRAHIRTSLSFSPSSSSFGARPSRAFFAFRRLGLKNSCCPGSLRSALWAQSLPPFRLEIERMLTRFLSSVGSGRVQPFLRAAFAPRSVALFFLNAFPSLAVSPRAVFPPTRPDPLFLPLSRPI